MGNEAGDKTNEINKSEFERIYKSFSNENYKRALVKKTYNQYNHIIVLGLTGRFGSGCSTACDWLASPAAMEGMGRVHFEDQLLLKNEHRDHNIIYDYAKKNIKFPFTVIKVRIILTSFILQDIDSFVQIIFEEYKERKRSLDEKNACLVGEETALLSGIKEAVFKGKDKLLTYINEKDIFKTQDSLLKYIENLNKIIWTGFESNAASTIQTLNKEKIDFIFSVLPIIADVFRSFLQNIEQSAYTRIYQHVGNIVRTYGGLKSQTNLEIIEESDPNNIYSVAERINYLIKILRIWDYLKDKIENNNNGNVKYNDVRVVIDSMKNNFEADYLKARYNSFYLVALTVDESIRKERLRDRFSHNIDDVDNMKQAVTLIDYNEYPSEYKQIFKKNEEKRKDENKPFSYEHIRDAVYESRINIFSFQNVETCIQNADILINNNGSTMELFTTLLRYVCLMNHPGLVTPTRDEHCMMRAQVAKINSGCLSRQVGAVICDRFGQIVSTGWNDPAHRIDSECISCLRRNIVDLHEKNDILAYSEYELEDEAFTQTVGNIFRDIHGDIEVVREIGEKSKEYPDADIVKAFLSDKSDGLPLSFCFKDIYNAIKDDKNQVHTRAQHGEEKAFEHTDKNEANGGTLYTTSSSCELCAKKAISYGISRIVYVEPYSGISEAHILGHNIARKVYDIEKEALYHMDKTIRVELFTGATQKAYVQLYTPLFPLKDELELRGVCLKPKKNDDNK